MGVPLRVTAPGTSDARYIDAVRRHDIVADELPGEFDLIHERCVLHHLAARNEVLPKLVAALRPGGWLLAPGRADIDAGPLEIGAGTQ